MPPPTPKKSMLDKREFCRELNPKKGSGSTIPGTTTGTVRNHNPEQQKTLAVPQSTLVINPLTPMEPLEPLNAMELTFF